jgi:hypothetical protein
MDTKLTLSIDERIIEKAKIFAKNNDTSLSKLIENFLFSLTSASKETQKENISPLVKNISGVINLSDNFDFKTDRINHLREKYK